MDIVKLKPATKDYLWGGEVLRKWGKQAPEGPLAEAWELSLNQNGPCLIDSGIDKGKTLVEVANKDDFGVNASNFPFFPVLIKLIDSAKPLSVQVHPSDDYALSHEGQYGKTELWRIIEAKKDAGIYLGFSRTVKLEEVKEALKRGTILDLLNFFPVKRGDSFFIPSGTIHAIGAGVTLLEIQQNSTLTYRLYDYGRLGNDGKPRELHIDKALQVIDLTAYKRQVFPAPIIGECPYFSSFEESVQGEKEIHASPKSFLCFTILNGKGIFDGMVFSRGNTFFVPAGKKATIGSDYATFVATEVK